MNEKRLKEYVKAFQELHKLHAQQNTNLRKLVENLHERLTLIELTNPILIEKLEKVLKNG